MIWLKITAVLAAIALLLLALDYLIQLKAKKHFLKRSLKPADIREKADYLVVLGCMVMRSGKPSDMLRDRLDCVVDAFRIGLAPKVIMSGDGRECSNQETAVMKAYAENKGVPGEVIAEDPEGFCTFDTMRNFKKAYPGKSAIFITQTYHLYRCVYDARSMGIPARGLSCGAKRYRKQLKRDLREIPARLKDFVLVHVKK